MKNREEKIRKTIRLSEEEYKKLKDNAALCGLTDNEFIRQLCLGLSPKPLPGDQFWDKMNELYECHRRLRMRAKQFEYEPALHDFYSERADELQNLVMRILKKLSPKMQNSASFLMS